uniref:Uncharacterized protein n=1 Tax=Lepeophtheirus salmonis TaxID=72036 RepID=A0A0K2VE62_LEPSM
MFSSDLVGVRLFTVASTVKLFDDLEEILKSPLFFPTVSAFSVER